MTEDVVGISNSHYAKRRGELMKLISSLRSIGAQAELDLPRIVCIGNQSAGKSSLIEAISRIRVPRDSGTCTRCPMECRLSLSDRPWTARISLRIEYDRTGKRLPETKSLNFGGEITEPKAIELQLRRAQSAILNYGSYNPFTDFLTMDEETFTKGDHVQKQLKFSKNVVCVEISGPELTDLVFIDLPGLIQNAEEDMIDLVEKLATEQIGGNSIILTTLPMSDDLENQKAALLAKKQDPEGLRTIGVLTKPDMLTAGATRSREAWLDVIEGRKHVLTHGYYCTRQPEDSERASGISFDAAREAETNFFQTTSPWSTSFQTERFGTLNLTEKLSAVLSQQIDESLPKLQADLKAALDRTNAELAQLPPSLSQDSSSELMNLVTKFCVAFGAYVDGARSSEILIQTNRKAYLAFKIAIRRSAPDFRPFVTDSETNGDIMDASEVVGDEPLPSQYPLVTAPLFLRDIRAHINQAKTRELPNNVPFPAKVALIERFTSVWGDPIETCFSDIRDQVSVILSRLISQTFARFSQLQSQVRVIIAEEMERSKAETQGMLAQMLRFERVPYTQNDHYYQSYREKYMAYYKAVRAGLVGDMQGNPKRRRIEASGTTSSINPGISLATDSETYNNFMATRQKLPESVPTGTQDAGKQKNSASTPPDPAPPTSTKAQPAPAVSTALGHGDAGHKSLSGSSPATLFGSPSLVARPQLSTSGFGAPETPKGVEKSATSAAFNSPARQNEALAALAQLGLHVTASDLQKLIPSDPWENEITVAAEVRSYYQTAYKRIIDNVPMAIDNMFLRSLSERMQSSMITGLGLGDKERAAFYLAEDRNIIAKREELLTRKKRLENVRQELLKFGY